MEHTRLCYWLKIGVGVTKLMVQYSYIFICTITSMVKYRGFSGIIIYRHILKN